MQFTLLTAPPWHRWVCDMEQVVERAAVPLARWTPQNLHCQRCSPLLPPGQGADWGSGSTSECQWRPAGAECESGQQCEQ